MTTLTQLSVNTDLNNTQVTGCTTRGPDASHKVRTLWDDELSKLYLLELTDGETRVNLYEATDADQEPYLSDLIFQILKGEYSLVEHDTLP